MTNSPRPGSPSDPTNPYHDPYQAYSDPAYAGSAPVGPSYSPTSMSPNPASTEPLPQYWTQSYQQSGPHPTIGFQPPEPPRGPRPWLWAAAGFALAVVLAMVVWLIFVNINPSRQQTAIPAIPSTPTRTPTPTMTRPSIPPIFPFPLPNLPLPTVPSTTAAPSNPGETEPVAYDVTGTGRAINITYIDTGGVMQTEFNVQLPWHKDVNLLKPAKDAASVTVINAGRNVTCKISIAGVEVQENTGALLTVCRPLG
jgi:hypothetical protein